MLLRSSVSRSIHGTETTEKGKGALMTATYECGRGCSDFCRVDPRWKFGLKRLGDLRVLGQQLFAGQMLDFKKNE